MNNLINYRYIVILFIASIFCNSYGLYDRQTRKRNVEAAVEKLNKTSLRIIQEVWKQNTNYDLTLKNDGWIIKDICETAKQGSLDIFNHKYLHPKRLRLWYNTVQYNNVGIQYNKLSCEEIIYLSQIGVIARLKAQSPTSG